MHPSFAHVVTRQGGVFTPDQARLRLPGSGPCSPAPRGVASNPWAGVYVDGDLPDDVPTLVGRCLWLGGDLVACHTTAALLWGFDLRAADAARSQPLHFLGPAARDNRRVRGLQVHWSRLGTDDVVLHRGVWCTTAGRTACDVVRLGPPVDGLATVDAALRSGGCSVDQLTAAADGQRGLRQVIRPRRRVPYADGRAESPMESRMRWRFIAGRLPVPDLQIEVRADGRRHRLDTGWGEQRLGAESDGLQAHMTRQQLDADRDRHNWLLEQGWRLLHFTAVDVYRPWERMVAMVERQLAARTLTIMVP